MADDRKLAHRVADGIGAVRVALKGGISGALRRAEDTLRDCVSMPFLDALLEQRDQLIAEGRIREERVNAPETATALLGIINDCRTATPDPRRLDIIRRAFLAAAIGDPADPEGTQALLFVDVATKLKAEDSAVLGSAYRHRGDHLDKHNTYSCFPSWVQAALSETGITFRAPLDESVKRLQELRLFYGEPGQSLTWYPSPTGPFTDFGVAFCEFLQRAEPFPEPPAKAAKPAT